MLVDVQRELVLVVEPAAAPVEGALVPLPGDLGQPPPEGVLLVLAVPPAVLLLQLPLRLELLSGHFYIYSRACVKWVSTINVMQFCKRNYPRL